MYNSLYYNQSKCFDPTQGYVLNKIERERKSKEAWLAIAKDMACKESMPGLKVPVVLADKK